MSFHLRLHELADPCRRDVLGSSAQKEVSHILSYIQYGSNTTHYYITIQAYIQLYSSIHTNVTNGLAIVVDKQPVCRGSTYIIIRMW